MLKTNSLPQPQSAAACTGEETARDAAVRLRKGEVEQQRAVVRCRRLSKETLDALNAVRMGGGLMAEIPREGERYDARQRRKKELVFAAWREGRADLWPTCRRRIDCGDLKRTLRIQ